MSKLIFREIINDKRISLLHGSDQKYNVVVYDLKLERYYMDKQRRFKDFDRASNYFNKLIKDWS